MDIPQPRKMLKIHNLITDLEPIFQRFQSRQSIMPTLSQLAYQFMPPSGSIVKVPLSELSSLRQSKQNKQTQMVRLKQEINNLQMGLEVTNISLDQYKAKCKQLMKTCEELYKISLKERDNYKSLEEQYIKLNKKYQEQFLNKPSSNPMNNIFNSLQTKQHIIKKEYNTQTDYWIPTLQVNKVQIVQELSNPKTQIDKRVQIVTTKLQQYLQNVSNQVNNSLSNIKNQQVSLKQLIEKNHELIKQNNQLKQQAQEFNLSKQKFNIWKQMLEHRMTELMKLADSSGGATINLTENVIEQYEPQSKIQMKQENIYMRNQIKKLRDTIIRLQLESKADKLRAKINPTQTNRQTQQNVHVNNLQMMDEQSLNLQNTIKTLAQLSNKLKIVSNYLLSSDSQNI